MIKYYIPVNGFIIQCDEITYQNFDRVEIAKNGIYTLIATAKCNSRACYMIRKDLFVVGETTFYMYIKSYINLKSAEKYLLKLE